MLTCFYIVEKIDGDYAMLRRIDETDPAAEPKMVARALLPPEIRVGSRLLFEYLVYGKSPEQERIYLSNEILLAENID